MKILFVHNRYRHEGGEEQAIDNLQRLLTEKGHTVSRFERSSNEWNAWPWWKKGSSILQTVYSWDTARSLGRVLETFDPDIVHVHNIYPLLSPSVYSAAQRRGIPIVQTLHNYRFLCANGLFLTPKGERCERCKAGGFWNAVRFGCYGNSRLRTFPIAASLATHRAKRTFEQAIDQYIAPTQFVRSKFLEAGFPDNRIAVIPHPTQSVTADAKRSPTPLFLYVGRLSKEKGVQTLLEAYQDPSLGHLTLVGDGPLADSLKQFAQTHRMNHVTFLGKVPSTEVFHWMAQAWALIVPSECYETFGQVVLESWSCGTPVIASKIGSLQELLEDGVTGRLFSMGDPKDLQAQIRKVIATGHYDEAMGARCQKKVRESFNRDKIYDQFMEVYRRAVGN